MQSLCVFCGAAHGTNPLYTQATQAFGHVLAQQNIELVWGGGNVGLMGVLADAVLAQKGKTYGVIPAFMVERELAHPQSSQMITVRSMHERKAVMAERAEGFVALPGGFGTLDEFFEIITWAQLGLHKKPIGLLNVNGFFDPLLAMAHHLQQEGFVKAEYLNMICVADSPNKLLTMMKNNGLAREDETPSFA